MKRLLLLLSLVISVCLISCQKDGGNYINLNVIELNDLHGYVNQAAYSKDYNLANAAYYINQKRSETNNEVLLVANGDMFEGTAFSNMTGGLSTINVMNELNFDMMGIGNHEFSWGLDSILKFFDGNLQNGEANFPLINGNVYLNGERVGENNTTDNILPYKVVQKGDIKIGMISYIGNLASSIGNENMGDYSISLNNFTASYMERRIKKDAIKCKEEGADVIIFNIHGGSSDGLGSYNINNLVASIKDDDGAYLIDGIINGHTHSVQEGMIKRDNGSSIPAVQGGSYCE